MNALVLLVATHFINLHQPGGRDIAINVAEISSISQPREDAEGHFDDRVRCVITMSNGKWNGVIETCLTVIKLIAETEEHRP